MARSNVRKRLIFLFIHHFFTACVSAIPLTNPVPFLHNVTLSGFASQNVTSPASRSSPLDYPIVGTQLVLRITETGDEFTEAATEKIMDLAIHEVVIIINRGSGRKSLLHDRFRALTRDIELRIQSIPNKHFTYFMLGKQSHRRWLVLNDLPITSLTRALRDVVVIFSAAQLRFRKPCTKY